MTPLVFAAGLICLALAPLLLIKPRSIVVNPAAYVLAAFTYAILAKAIYFTQFHYPVYKPTDRIFGFETSPDFLWTGIWIAAVAAAAYIIGFLAPRSYVPSKLLEVASDDPGIPKVPLSGAVLPPRRTTAGSPTRKPRRNTRTAQRR